MIESRMKEAKSKLAKYCAYQERCTSEVLKKMESLQLSEDQMIDLVRWLTKESFLDDKRFTEQFVIGKFRSKQWGKVKIRYELRRKGILDSFIETAIEQTLSEEEYLETAQKLTDKKRKNLGSKNDLLTQKKIQTYLQQKGYEWETIRQVMDN